MTQREAVFQAIEDGIGSLSKVPVLKRAAEDIYGYEIAYTAVVTYRSEWRKENKIQQDARTHKDVFRRNMLDDNEYTSKQVERGIEYFKKMWPKEDDLLRLIGSGKGAFHSVHQLASFLNHRKAIKLAA